jgi:hypothetical protein
MEKHPSGITLESWLVSGGRSSEPGAPLNVPMIPASNFTIGSGREIRGDDGGTRVGFAIPRSSRALLLRYPGIILALR